MASLEDAINRINNSATKTENTAEFLDNVGTGTETQSFTNPNNGVTVPSIRKWLLDEFNDRATEINQAVSDAQAAQAAAETAETNAEQSAQNAATQVTLATAQADRAEAEADRAEEVTGLDTVEQAVDLALEREILGIRTQVQVEADIEQWNEKLAAGGYQHFGKHRTTLSVNEGISCGDFDNQIRLGRSSSGLVAAGLSKTDFPVLNANGTQIELQFVNLNVANEGVMLPFEDSPDGTETYDRVSGVTNDYTTYTDPKYGNVAADRNEAVARAFEGRVRNGDFRNNETDWTLINTSTTSTFTVTNGIATITTGVTAGTQDRIQQDITSFIPDLAGEYVCDVVYEQVSGSGRISIWDGDETLIIETPTGPSNGVTRATVTIPTPSTPSTVYRLELRATRLSNSAGELRVHSISVRPSSEEVVTEREDIWAIETWVEEVTTTNPFVYPKGCINSLKPDMNGITTTSSTRPITYYANYPGDTEHRGLGVNFFNASPSEQATMVQDKTNNIWKTVDGRILQSRARVLTMKGSGNGPWASIDPNVSGSRTLSYNSTSATFRFPSQGKLDTRFADGTGNAYFASTYSDFNDDSIRHLGAWTARSSVVSDFGKCYIFIGGKIPRANQGAYWPELNESGTRRANNATTGSDSGAYWNEAIKITKPVQCFTYVDAGTDTTTPAAAQSSGGRGQVSGRFHDEAFYNVIRPDGLNGVVDLRNTAWDVSSIEHARNIERGLYSGTYRGLEKPKFTTVINIDSSLTPSSNAYWTGTNIDGSDTQGGWIGLNRVAAEYNFSVGDRIHVYKAASGTIRSGTVSSFQISSTVNFFVRVFWDPETWTSDVTEAADNDSYAIFERLSTLPVSGSNPVRHVIGDPSVILQSFPINNGWLGKWVPIIPDGVIDSYTLIDKSLTVSVGTVTSTDTGTTWTRATTNVNSISNAVSLTPATGTIIMIDLASYAEQTVRTDDNFELPHYASSAFGGMSTTNSSLSYASSMVASILGKSPNVSNSWQSFVSGLTVNAPVVTDTGLIFNTVTQERNSLSTRPVQQTATTPEDTVGLKAIVAQTVTRNQLSLGIMFNQIRHNGSSWGDETDNKVYIAYGRFVRTDQNNLRYIIGTNTLAIPYGYIKNEI